MNEMVPQAREMDLKLHARAQREESQLSPFSTQRKTSEQECAAVAWSLDKDGAPESI